MRAIALLLLLLASAGAAESAVRGRILRTGGTASGAVRVTLGRHGEEDAAEGASKLVAATPDAEGRFALAFAGGDCAVTVWVGGLPAWGRSHIKPGASLGDIAISGGLAIEGSVTTPDGAPLAGVPLKLALHHDNTCSHWSRVAGPRTDADGAFAIEGLSAGTWQVSVDDERWAPSGQEVKLAAGGPALIQLVVQPGAVVAGLVKDGAGRPVSGATVAAGHGGRSALTGSDGRYRLAGLAAGEIRLEAKAPGLAMPGRSGTELKLAAGATTAHDIVLQPTGMLRLEVSAEPGLALPATAALGFNPKGPGPIDHRQAALVAGTATIADLAPGRYSVSASGEGTGEASFDVVIPAGGSATAALLLPRAYGFAGRVLGPDGLPPAKAEARGYIERKRGRGTTFTSHEEAEVDDQGRFRFVRLAAGQFKLTVRAPGFVPQVHSIAIGPESPAGEREFVLATGLRLAVEVRDGDGAAIVGAKIELAPKLDRDRGGDSAETEGETDAQGRAVLTGLGAGAHTLKVSHDRWMAEERTVSLPDEGETIGVVLAAGESIAGTLLEADGRPLSGVSIAAWGPQGARGGWQHREARTDAKGAFSLQGLKPGSYQVSARQDGDQLLQTTLKTGSPAAELKLQPLVTCPVRVVDEAGAPLAGIEVAAEPMGREEGGVRTEATTGADGSAELGLRAGSAYQLEAKGEGLLPGTAQVTPVAGATLPVAVLTLGRGVELVGTVLDAEGRPARGVKIAAQPVNQRGRMQVELPDPQEIAADGAFRITGLPRTTVQLVVTAAEGEEDRMQQMQLARKKVTLPAKGQPAPVTVQLPPMGAVSGTVRGLRGEHANVWLQQQGKGESVMLIELEQDGSFRCDRVPTGRWTLTASGDEGLPVSTAIDIRPGITATAALVVVDAGVTVSGAIAAPAWTATAAQLTLVPDPGRPLTPLEFASQRSLTRRAQLDEDGAFRISKVVPGSYLLQAVDRQPGRTLAWCQPLEVGDHPQPVQVAPAGVTITGRVTGLDGRPSAGAWVQVFPRLDCPCLLRAWQRMTTVASDGDGAFRMGLLPPGTYQVVVRADAGAGMAFVESLEVAEGMGPLALALTSPLAIAVEVAGSGAATRATVVAMRRGTVWSFSAETGDDGIARFAGKQALPPGDYDLWACADGSAVAHARLTAASGATAALALAPGGDLAVTVVGDHRAGQVVELRDAAGRPLPRPCNPMWSRFWPQLVAPPSGEDGRLEVKGLAPGVWTVGLRGAAGSATVAVAAGATAGLELPAP